MQVVSTGKIDYQKSNTCGQGDENKQEVKWEKR